MKKLLTIALLLMLTAASYAQKATIEKVWIDHGQTRNGENGMLIHVKFEVNNAKGHDIYVQAWIQRPKGTYLKSTNSNYKGSDGWALSKNHGTATYENSVWNDFDLWMPLSAFNMENGKNTYYVRIDIFDNTIKKHITVAPGYCSFIGTGSGNNNQGNNVAYMDVLKKYAPFYYKRKIISSEKIEDTSYQKHYRYYDSAGFEINVSLFQCSFCIGSGKSPFNGQFCGVCFGAGWTRFVTAWNKKTSVMLDGDGHPTSAGGSTTHSSGSSNSGSSSGGRSGSGSVYTTCRICNGSGVCTSCNGRGTSLYTYGGSDNTTCSSCHGNRRCFNCHGTGRQ